ncbi:sigma-70 family RNA polymerase sigma factor [Roseivirga sp. UBA1976]|jgi:RNA polymerase sigma-70 factor (ECF subfamily)|uniref:sigma-70 family RNA polymerase sigma factor n=1 Tax=Roseivirga sp. UBA1976 TaxID=1947386 RepID=UPI00257EDBA3|nr:sigma-70 family RNA polymerase sigma factor [Roseivirga sp. UBA1976]|tara:strand:+ start:3721 stop:4575 length:855 start_codon:yes stop_codon:yes gene_type:complete
MNNYQQLLFPYAYNILGSVEDAKDAIQDVVTKLSSARGQYPDSKNYLIKSVINRSINIKEQKLKNEQLNNQLPEPYVLASAEETVNNQQVLSYAMLTLLNHLTAKERAVFILKEAFGYKHEETAELLGQSTENTRQLLSRAKKKLSGLRQKHAVKPVKLPGTEAILAHYLTAIRNKDLKALEQVLKEDIGFRADGGSGLKVLARVAQGAQEVAQLLFTVYERFLKECTITPTVVNHFPALLYWTPSNLKLCQVFEINRFGQIEHLYHVLDPEKLSNLRLAVQEP